MRNPKVIIGAFVASATLLGTATLAAAGDNPDGTYTVERGDSLSEITVDHNVPEEWWRALAADNGIDASKADSVEVGQVLDLRVFKDTELAKLARWYGWFSFDHGDYDAQQRALAEQARAARAAQAARAQSAPSVSSNPAPSPEPAPAAPAPRSSGWAIPESIVMCESGGDYTAHNPNSSASGAYQITDGTWAAYGGLSYAPSAAQATPGQQDEIARRIWDGGAGRGHWVC